MSTSYNNKKAYAFAGGAVALWSTVATAFKIALESVDYLQLLFWSSAVSCIVLFVILFAQRKTYLLKKYSATDYLKSAALGFLNPFLYYVLLFKAYSLLPAQEALTLNYTWAVVITLLSVPILGQKLSLKSLGAVLIGFFGAMVIATHGDLLSLEFSDELGVALALSSSVVWALFWLYNVKDKRDATAKLFLNFLFGFMFVAGYSFVNYYGFDSDFAAFIIPDLESMFAVSYVGLFEMGITFTLWLKALRYAKSTASVSNLIYFSPFLSLLLINMILGEEILISTIAGLGLILIGIFVQRKS
ncbi:MAG: DMT family transporter [Candidatus Kapabacteria bacterium]|jgi:drug/metabolite transporter (DMT)-like permease|nr:DMT family transporter [Candidatus Kapabacteria bacterium]